jgi:hypothetical protein
MWANILLVMPFILIWVGVPMLMTFKHQDAAPDFSEAHAYLAAKDRQPGVSGAGRRQDIADQLEAPVAA